MKRFTSTPKNLITTIKYYIGSPTTFTAKEGDINLNIPRKAANFLMSIKSMVYKCI